MQRVNFRLSIATLVIIIVTCSLCGFAKSHHSGAIIEFKESTYNFGTVSRKGASPSHKFRLYNRGTTPLVITNVNTTCTCLKAKYSRRPLMPNDSMEMDIIYEIKRKEVGTFSKIVKIYSNATNAPYQVITINGESVDKR